ncbi:MAG: hypothetical protein ACRD1K_16185 [Acidimicrobiales bacterium]
MRVLTRTWPVAPAGTAGGSAHAVRTDPAPHTSSTGKVPSSALALASPRAPPYPLPPTQSRATASTAPPFPVEGAHVDDDGAGAQQGDGNRAMATAVAPRSPRLNRRIA